jgi:hypothetical protein
MKSSSWSGGSLSITPNGTRAAIKGKATVIIVNAATGKRSTTLEPDLPAGRYRQRIRRLERPVRPVDWDGTVLWHQTGTATSPITLGGGNITIHKR